MKKGLLSIGILAGFILSVLVVSGVFAKDVVDFNVSYGKVTFTHKKHAETLKIACVKCHHDWKPDQKTGKLCKDCHKEKQEGKVASKKDAYHKDCKGCHDEAKKANKPAGPTGCTQCHVKAKK